MLGRRLLAVALAAAVLTAPPLARTRLFCRWTGAEVASSDCPDAQDVDGQGLRDAGCCDHRIQSPLPSARVQSGNSLDGAPAATSVELVWFVPFTDDPALPADASPPRPPPLEASGILLI